MAEREQSQEEIDLRGWIDERPYTSRVASNALHVCELLARAESEVARLTRERDEARAALAAYESDEIRYVVDRNGARDHVTVSGMAAQVAQARAKALEEAAGVCDEMERKAEDLAWANAAETLAGRIRALAKGRE